MGQKRQESVEGDSIQESGVRSQEKGIGQKRQSQEKETVFRSQ